MSNFFSSLKIKKNILHPNFPIALHCIKSTLVFPNTIILKLNNNHPQFRFISRNNSIKEHKRKKKSYGTMEIIVHPTSRLETQIRISP